MLKYECLRSFLPGSERSGRDALMWIVIYICSEAALEIALYSYLYLKLAEMLSFLLSLMFSLQQNLENKRAEHVLPRSRKWGDEGRWPKLCIHM
jgi:hypothetical protein